MAGTMVKVLYTLGVTSAWVAPSTRLFVGRVGALRSENRPVGGLEAASEEDYEKWISSQLRLNRIQDKVVGMEDRVVEALRRPDAAAALSGIGRDIDALVATNNGVTDRATSTLLTVGRRWEELLPLRGLFRKFARFRSMGKGVVFEREARLFGPLLSVGAVGDGVAKDSITLTIQPRFWGGVYVRLLGVTLPLPRLLGGGERKQRELVVVYLAGDVAVVVDRKADGDALCVYATPAAPSFTSPLRLRAKVRALRQRRAAATQRRDRIRAASAAARSGALVGDVAWRSVEDQPMDVDEARMQRFLDNPDKFKTRFSVQDMLDGRISVDDELREADPLREILGDDERSSSFF